MSLVKLVGYCTVCRRKGLARTYIACETRVWNRGRSNSYFGYFEVTNNPKTKPTGIVVRKYRCTVPHLVYKSLAKLVNEGEGDYN